MANLIIDELLQAPTEGYGEAIVILEMLAENFEIKTNVLQLVQTNKFHSFERDNPHTHISNFKRMTSTLKYRDVHNDAIKLMLFPYSLEGAARIWYEKEPPNSILTWDDLVNKFVNQFSIPLRPPTLKMKSLDSHKDSRRHLERLGNVSRKCLEHDSLNATVGGNLLSKTTREALKIIENKSKVHYSRSKSNVSRVNTNFRESSSKTDDRIDKLADQISNLVEIVDKQFITPATAKAVEKTCVIYGGVHAYYDCIATDSNQPSACAATEPDVSKTQPTPSIPYPSRLNDQKLREKATNQMEKFFQIFHDLHFDISFADALLLMPKFASTIKSSLTNKDKLFELAKVPLNENCSAMLLKKLPEKLRDPSKFLIPCDFPRIDVCHALADLGASINLMPLTIWKKLSLPEHTPTRMTLELADRSITHPKGVAEDVFVKVGKFHFPIDFVVVDFDADPRVPLILGRSFLRTSRALIDVYGEEITLRINDKSITFNLNKTMSNPTLVFNPSFSEETKSDFYKEPIVKSSSPTLNPFGESDFFLEEIEDFLNDESIPTRIENSFYDPKGDILYLEKLLNEDPFQLPSMDLKQAEETKAKSSIEEPPELELKELPSHLEYAFLEDTDKLPVIIAKDLKDVEKEALIKVIKSHKQAIAWKIFDIKGIDPRFCTHKILMDEDYKPAVQSQRQVNPKIHDVIKNEVITLLDAGMIYLISDSPWVSPIHCVPKKGGMTVVANENNELFPTRLVTGYFQILIDPQDQEKTTFTCPYETFAYRRMPFGLCNAPVTFQRQDVKCCEDTNLVLNWEKCHFMCKEGIVLGHKILKFRINVDRVKVDVIAKLLHPTTVKGVRSFLGHAGFYRRFIQDFSKIPRPMTRLLENETPFVFSKECVDAFDTLKKKLTEAPILVVPDWNLPFKLMCDASDFDCIVYTDQSALKYLLNKQDAKPRLLWWVLLLQEFDITIRDKKGSENLTADHLSRLENPHKDVLENKDINENFPLETLGSLSSEATDILKACHEGPAGGHHDANLTAKKFARVMIKYGITHRLATAYHPQTSGQVEVSNRGLKRILERTVEENHASWSDKLDDALWAFRTAFKTPIGCTPYKLVYEKSCHLLIELEHKVYWALKHVNFDLKIAGDHRKLQLNELNELRDQAYENSLIYKERTKKFPDSKIKNRNVGDQVLLFNSRLKIFSGKQKTRWSGPFTITQVFLYGTVELSQLNGPNFKVNGHRVKHYFGGDISSKVVPDLHTFPMDK
nr:DNA-directed DNA polymerase [Tanacetum cinerariifolium]